MRVSNHAELPQGTETILLVEDEESVRNVAVRMLKRQGYQVLAYPNGDEALKSMKELDERKGKQAIVNLLITDVVMPGINGPAPRRADAIGPPRAYRALHLGVHRERRRPPRGTRQGHRFSSPSPTHCRDSRSE